MSVLPNNIQDFVSTFLSATCMPHVKTLFFGTSSTKISGKTEEHMGLQCHDITLSQIKMSVFSVLFGWTF
uniref:Uncharacterized protein n=1 Tax=Anguilla anguilla TaxID=7936 RepID=A0A0E9WN23_ANGAN